MKLETLRKRAELLELVRGFFCQRGFCEVQTPLALDEVIPEAHIEPVRTADGRYLQASPELAMKRLLCAGSGPIFQICQAFRDDERGPLHRPEFTIVEWYRPGDDMRAGINLLNEFVQAALDAAPCKRTSYRDAFSRIVQIDPHTATIDTLWRCHMERGVVIPALHDLSMSRDDRLNIMLADLIEPHLGFPEPEMLYHYPASQAAIAKTASDGAGAEVAERFELYYRGTELANGYHELTDATELRARLEEANALRVREGRPALPLPEALLADMASPGLPPCAGVALGFDRLLMLAVGATSLDDL